MSPFFCFLTNGGSGSSRGRGGGGRGVRGARTKIWRTFLFFSLATVTKLKPHPNICCDVLQTGCGPAPDILKRTFLVINVVRGDEMETGRRFRSTRLQPETSSSLFWEYFCRHPLPPQEGAKESFPFLLLNGGDGEM